MRLRVVVAENILCSLLMCVAVDSLASLETIVKKALLSESLYCVPVQNSNDCVPSTFAVREVINSGYVFGMIDNKLTEKMESAANVDSVVNDGRPISALLMKQSLNVDSEDSQMEDGVEKTLLQKYFLLKEKYLLDTSLGGEYTQIVWLFCSAVIGLAVVGRNRRITSSMRSMQI